MFRSDPLAHPASLSGGLLGSIPTRGECQRIIFDGVGDTPMAGKHYRIGLKSPERYPTVNNGGLSLLLSKALPRSRVSVLCCQ